ncbi:MAG TPA: response regulator [Mycobacteriales bacterium]|nr:response regulator [Mycobacteriales bacterium]
MTRETKQPVKAAGKPADDGDARTVATVLFTDVVGSTEIAARIGDAAWRSLLDAHDALIRSALQQHDGRELSTMGDGFFAVFETPADAVRCALQVVATVPSLDLAVRAGIHTGECVKRGDSIGGIAVHIAARVSALAEGGEVLVSSTVKDLVTGAGLAFQSRGGHALKGVPGRWRVYAATAAAPTSVKPARKAPAKPGRAQRATEEAPKRPRRSAGGIRVLLVDDHPMWRETLRSVVEHTPIGTVVAQASDGAEAVELASVHQPDVVIMDMDLPVLHGIDATRQIVAADPAPKVLVLSSSDDKDQVLAAIRAGACGYLLKTLAPAELAEAVRRVSRGELVLPANLSDVVLRELRQPSPQPAAQVAELRVAVAGDVLLHREGLAKLVKEAGFQLAGSPTAAEQVLAGLEAEATDVLLLDVASAGKRRSTALDVVRDVRAAHPALGVLVLSDEASPEQVGPLLDAYSTRFGYVLKERVDDLAQLADAVRRVATGELVVDPSVVSTLLAERRNGAQEQRLNDLSTRERDVLALMAEGRSNQAIAERLHLGAKTVEAHVASIFTKLGLETARDDHRRVLAVVAFLQHDGAAPG